MCVEKEERRKLDSEQTSVCHNCHSLWPGRGSAVDEV